MTAITTSITLSLGFLHFHEKGLLISLIVGQTLAFLLLLGQTMKNDKLLFAFISKSEIKTALQRHIAFPKYNMPQGLLDGIKESSIVWIISNFFGMHTLGSFAFAKSILMRPLQIIGGAVNQVFYQKASSVYNETGNIYNLSKKTFFILFAVGLPFALIVFLWGDIIFSFVFSTKWKEAGAFAQILIFFLLFSFVGSAISSIPLILNNQKQFFHGALLITPIQISILFISGLLGRGIFFTLTSFSIISIFFYFIIFIWFYNIVKFKSI